MPTLEELEHRVARLESLFEVIKERLNSISQRLDQLYEKTERDKTEILAKLYEKTEGLRIEILTKTEKDKREIINWMIGLLIGFATLIITAMWALLSFAIRP